MLDVGSNTVHLLMVDAHSGAHPVPMSSDKDQLRLAENLDPRGALTKGGVEIPPNGSIKLEEQVLLNVQGDIGPNAGGGARTARAFARIFYRVNGIPFAKTVVDDESNPVGGGNTAFTLKADRPFTPRHTTVYAVHVVSWDKAAVLSADIRDSLKQHMSRVRVEK